PCPYGRSSRCAMTSRRWSNGIRRRLHAIRPITTSRVRQWRGQSFAQQIAALRDAWLYADQWVEGREREQIDVWGADWQGFRRRLLGDLREIDPQHWFLLTDVSRRFAERDTSIIGSTLPGPPPPGGKDRGDARARASSPSIGVGL